MNSVSNPVLLNYCNWYQSQRGLLPLVSRQQLFPHRVGLAENCPRTRLAPHPPRPVYPQPRSWTRDGLSQTAWAAHLSNCVQNTHVPLCRRL